MKSLYIHIPFCQRKCLFCSFAITIGQQHRMDDYIDVITNEMKAYRGESVVTVYIGGGTPTMLSPAQLERLSRSIHKSFDMSACKEWTIEANPEGVSTEKLSVLKDMCVTRFSLGVQSFQDRWLKFLGRCHDAETAFRTYHMLRENGWANINVDLMYSFPGQTDEDIQEDVRKMAALDSEHVSLYALTIEDQSRFGAQAMRLDDEDVRAGQYQLVVDTLHEAGVSQYEVSNFARDNLYSLHNRHYWIGGEYIGIGVGAHSHISGRRYWNDDRFLSYMKKSASGESIVAGEEVLSSYQRMMEVFLFGLRMNEGIDAGEVQKRFGISLTEEQQETLSHLSREGFLIRTGERLAVTDKGRLVLDEISVRLM